MNEKTRRELLKRLAVVAAAGYVAPKAVSIGEAWAGKKKKKKKKKKKCKKKKDPLCC